MSRESRRLRCQLFNPSVRRRSKESLVISLIKPARQVTSFTRVTPSLASKSTLRKGEKNKRWNGYFHSVNFWRHCVSLGKIVIISSARVLFFSFFFWWWLLCNDVVTLYDVMSEGYFYPGHSHLEKFNDKQRRQFIKHDRCITHRPASTFGQMLW